MVCIAVIPPRFFLNICLTILDADTALALGSANPTYGSPLSQFSDLSFDDETFMDFSDGEHSIPSPAALKRKLPSLLSSSESNSALGPAPSKRARRSRTAGATGVGESPPPESPTEQDGFVTDTDMENFLESILNELAEETQQRNAQQESYTPDPLDAVPDSSAQNSLPSSPSTTTNLFLSSYDNMVDDESSENLLNRCESLCSS
jgi:hypothetical protein